MVQKAIAIVQKAIDEDVKQNYAVGVVSPGWVLLIRIGGVQAISGFPGLLHDGTLPSLLLS